VRVGILISPNTSSPCFGVVGWRGVELDVEVEAPGVVGYSSVDVLLCCCEVEDLARRLNSVSYNAILNKPLMVERDSGREGRVVTG
jgi:hypothetical protein